MNKKTITTILVSLVLVLAIIFLFMFVFKKPVSQNEANKNVSKQASDAASELLKINRTALAQTPNGELPVISATDNISGDIKAGVQVIVYENLNDVYSSKLNETLKQVKALYADKIVIAYRPFVFKGDTLGFNSAVAVSCAAEQGKFLEMRDLILADTASSSLTMVNFSGYVKSLDMDKAKFSACLSADASVTAVNSVIDKVANSMVFGSPTTFVNGELVVGARSFDDGQDTNGKKLEGLKSIVARHLQ
ncbi:MAG: thioredoxin domain-containing protein [Candidatus Falkowbacteria bacterium]